MTILSRCVSIVDAGIVMLKLRRHRVPRDPFLWFFVAEVGDCPVGGKDYAKNVQCRGDHVALCIASP